MDGSVIFLIAFILGLLLGGAFIYSLDILPIELNQETADDICKQLIGNETQNIEAKSENGKLICEVPSFDNTQNIIFQKNSEDDS